MTYIDGFIAAVPAANKEAYIAFARASGAIFQRKGALRMVEGWGDDVPDGVVTSFPMAVQRAEGEVVLFSWIEWPDKATRDACHASMMQDPAWQALGEMPFDGKRMVYGGFVPVLDMGPAG
jgi:uncharacterized protein YbaA (DUF1428 family)